MDLVLYSAELIGTAAFALSGALLAIQKKLDLFGMLFLGVVTALGGGTIRDLLLGVTPPKMFYSYEYVVLAAAVSVLAFLAARRTRGRQHALAGRMELLYSLCDAVGLGIFAVIGTEAGMAAGYGDNGFLCVFLGMTTGVGGGILRDMMCSHVPGVLYKHVYAVAAIAGSGVFYLLERLGTPDAAATLTGMAVTVALRVLARHYRWNLPKVEE